MWLGVCGPAAPDVTVPSLPLPTPVAPVVRAPLGGLLVWEASPADKGGVPEVGAATDNSS